MLYQKLSGRKGDPYDRYAQAVAQSELRKAEVRSQKESLHNSKRRAGMAAKGGVFTSIIHIIRTLLRL